MTLTAMLNPRQKAAVIVRVLLQDERDLSLEALSGDEQVALVRELAGMPMIDRKTRDAIVAEFCDTLEQVGVTFPEGLDSALALLSGKISTDCADRLRRIAILTGDSDPWERLLALPTKHVVALAKSEAIEMSAVLFSRLPVSKAAEAFSKLPTERARKIAYAMSMAAGIEAEPLHRIGLALTQAAEALPRPALPDAPVDKVGAILNQATAVTRDGVLSGLEQDDREFADDVRRTIFTWENIPDRIEPRDIPRILRQVDQASLIRALAANPDEGVAAFIFASIPSRMGDMLREEIEGLGRVTAGDTEKAMAAVVATIRDMETQGELTMIMPEDDDGTGLDAADG